MADRKHILAILISLLMGFGMGSFAVASPAVTYHGRLMLADGVTPLAGAVQFRLSVYSPGGESCLMYREVHNRTLTDGKFSITLNDTVTPPSTPNAEPFTLDRVFQNRGTFTFAGGKCGSGTTYIPGATDGRKLVMEFDDGTAPAGWDPVPTQMVNAAPSALESVTVGGFNANSLLRVTNAGEPDSVSAITRAQYDVLNGILTATPSNKNVLRWNSGTTLWEPAMVDYADVTGKPATFSPSAHSHVVSDITSGAGAYFTYRPNNVACATNEILKWDGTNWICAVAAGGGTVTSVSGTAPLASSGGTTPAISIANGSATGQTLRWGGAAWSAAKLVYTDLVNGSALSPWPSTCTAGQYVFWNSGTDAFECSSLTAGQITTALTYTPVNKAGDTMTGNLIMNNVALRLTDSGGTNFMGLKAPATVTTSRTLTLPDGYGTAGQALTTDGTTGQLSWTTISAGGSGDFMKDGSVAMTGALQASGGSLSAPGYTFSGDLNTGIYSDIADKVQVSSGGTKTAEFAAGLVKICNDTFTCDISLNGDRLYVKASTYSVGVGTNNPAAQLHVARGDASGPGTLRISNADLTASEQIGELSFAALDSGSTTQVYSTITSNIVSPTSGAEAGQLDFWTTVAGTSASRMTIGSNVTVNGGNLVVNNQQSLRLMNTGSTKYMALRAPGTVTTDTTLTLPDGVGTSGQALTTDGTTGQLSWTTISSGGGDFMKDGSVAMTGALKATDGLVGTPSITFGTDLNTGLYLPAADTFAVTTAGAERVRIDSSGNVGIGIAPTTAKLTAQGTILSLAGADPAAAVAAPYMSAPVASGFSSSPAYSFWYQSTTGISNPANNQIGFVTAGTERVRLGATGDVTVTGGNFIVNNQSALRLMNTGSTKYMAFRAPSSMTAASTTLTLPDGDGLGGQVLSTNGSGALSWASVPSTGGTIVASAGAVGTPSYTFTGDLNTGIYSSGADVVDVSAGNNRVMSFANALNTAYVNLTLSTTGAPLLNNTTPMTAGTPGYAFNGDPNTGIYNSAADTIDIATNGTSRMNIDSAGVVNVTSGPLIVKSNSAGSGTTLDFASGNLQYTTANCQSGINLHNVKEGGSYTAIIKGAGGGTCSFNVYTGAGTGAYAGANIHMPADHGAATASKHTLYTILVAGGDVYISWMPGL